MDGWYGNLQIMHHAMIDLFRCKSELNVIFCEWRQRWLLIALNLFDSPG